MKRILFFIRTVLLILVMLFIGSVCFAESWQPTSTMYVWDGAEWVRAEADVTNFLIVHTSTDSDVNIYHDGNRARVIQGNSDGEDPTDYGLLTRGMIYGWNGTSWDRLRITEDDHFWVRTDTNSVVGIYQDGQIANVEQASADGAASTIWGLVTNNRLYGFNGTAWDRWRINDLDHMYVETDTNSVTGIYKDGNIVDVEQGNASGLAATLWGLVGQNMLYGFNGSAWDRLLVDEMDNLKVVTGTNSVTQAMNYFWNGTSWEKGISNEQGHQVVETDTNSVTGVYYDGNTAVVMQGNADDVSPTLYGLQTQSNLYALDGTAGWDRLTMTSGNLNVNDANTEAVLDDIYEQLKTSVTISDILYSGKVSTGTAGKLNSSGNIAVTAYSMEAYTFYSDGGDTTITSTWYDGTIYALDGIPVNPQKLSIPISNPTFQCTLPANTTFYYILHGVQ